MAETTQTDRDAAIARAARKIQSVRWSSVFADSLAAIILATMSAPSVGSNTAPIESIPANIASMIQCKQSATARRDVSTAVDKTGAYVDICR